MAANATGDLALLVDGDNVPPEMLAPLLAHLERRANVTERCIFRNWRSTRDSKTWDEAAKKLAFVRVDRYKTTEGKNGSDIAVAVAAMDFLHQGMRNFCIASGDTDFAPLVERLRRAGAWVSIIGHKMDGGLLREIADEYQDWKSLMPKLPAKARTASGANAPKPPAPGRRGQRAAKSPVAPPTPAARPPRLVPEKPQRPGRRDPDLEKAPKPGDARRAPPKDQVPHSGARDRERPMRRTRPSEPAQPTRGQPPLPLAGSEALRSILTDCYEVARTDGEVDAQGWVAVDRLGQIARSLDPDFKPAKYGLGSRTPFSKAFERFPAIFAIEAIGRQGNRQYRVRLK